MSGIKTVFFSWKNKLNDYLLLQMIILYGCGRSVLSYRPFLLIFEATSSQKFSQYGRGRNFPGGNRLNIREELQ